MSDWKMIHGKKWRTWRSRFILFVRLTVATFDLSSSKRWRTSFELSIVDSYFACCFDGSLYSCRRCNYVSRAELINSTMLALHDLPTWKPVAIHSARSCSRSHSNIDDFQLFFFFPPLFAFIPHVDLCYHCKLYSTATAMCFFGHLFGRLLRMLYIQSDFLRFVQVRVV